MNQKATRIFVVEEKYSTTRRVIRTPPVGLNKPDDKVYSMLFLPETSGRKAEGGLRTQGLFKCNTTDKLLISVITVVFNGAQYIEQTITSIIGQTYDNVEYIIVDGGSTDNTLNIIKKYDGQIDYWVSESDKGIADAMNKGLALATGEYIVFIHADDYLYSNESLSKATDYFTDEYSIFLFDILFGTDVKKRVHARGLNFWINLRNGVPHQGAVTRLSLFKEQGFFDTRFKVSMDYGFFVRCYKKGYRSLNVKKILSVMRDTGISSKKDWESLLDRFSEERMIQNEASKSSFVRLFYKLFWFFYIPYRRILSII